MPEIGTSGLMEWTRILKGAKLTSGTPDWGLNRMKRCGSSRVRGRRMFEFIRMHFGPERLALRLAFLFHYLLAMAGAKSIKKLLPIIEKSFDNPWVTRVELGFRFSPGWETKPNLLWRLFKMPPENDLTHWDAPVTVSVFRKRRGRERPALCMSLYVRSKVLYIAQLQGVAGTDVPAELRPWPKIFIEACKKFACQQGLREVRVAKASTLDSFRFPYGGSKTLTEDLKQAIPRIRRNMELLYDRNALQAGLVPDGNWFKWQNATSIRSYQLSRSQHATRVAASLGLIAATTAILFQMDGNDEPQRLVYFYLLPVVLIAVLYTGRAAMLCAGVAILCADYFLQDPLFSFYTAEWVDLIDLIWFAVLAAFAIKTTGNLLPPSSPDSASSR
jgi:Domain of unknown function (DUF4118)